MVDEAEFEALLLDRADQLDRFVRRKLPADVRRVVAAEDVLQEVWTSAYRRISGFEPRGPDDFDRWLRKITESKLVDAIRYARRSKRGGGRRLAQDAHRRTDSYLRLFARIAREERTPSSEDAAKEAVHAVQVAVAGLSDDYRYVVVLHHINGQTRGEIADSMGKSQAAVNSLLYRALRKLRVRLGRTDRYFNCYPRGREGKLRARHAARCGNAPAGDRS